MLELQLFTRVIKGANQEHRSHIPSFPWHLFSFVLADGDSEPPGD